MQPALPRRRRVGERREHRLRDAAVARLAAVLSHQEPVLRVAVHVRRDERPLALQARAVQLHGEPAVALSLDELVGARVPDLDGPAAVLACRDLALERRVLERMILDVHGEPAVALAHRHALRHRPAQEDAVLLEAQVVVQAARVVALDDEERIAAFPAPAAEGLRRLLRVALLPVRLERGHPRARARGVSVEIMSAPASTARESRSRQRAVSVSSVPTLSRMPS